MIKEIVEKNDFFKQMYKDTSRLESIASINLLKISLKNISIDLKNFFLHNENKNNEFIVDTLNKLAIHCITNSSQKNIKIFNLIITNQSLSIRTIIIINNLIISGIVNPKFFYKILSMYIKKCNPLLVGTESSLKSIKNQLGKEAFSRFFKNNKISISEKENIDPVVDIMISNNIKFKALSFYNSIQMAPDTIHKFTKYLIKTKQKNSLKIFTRQVINKMTREKVSGKDLEKANLITPHLKTLRLLRKHSCFNFFTILRSLIVPSSILTAISNENINSIKKAIKKQTKNEIFNDINLFEIKGIRLRINNYIMISKITNIPLEELITGRKLILSLDGGPAIQKFAIDHKETIKQCISNFSIENQKECLFYIIKHGIINRTFFLNDFLEDSINKFGSFKNSLFLADMQTKSIKNFCIHDDDFVEFLIRNSHNPVEIAFQSNRKQLKKIFYTKICSKTELNMYGLYLLYVSFIKKELNQDLVLNLLEQMNFDQDCVQLVNSTPILLIFNKNYTEAQSLSLFNSIFQVNEHSFELSKFCETLAINKIFPKLNSKKNIHLLHLELKRIYLRLTYKNISTNFKHISKLDNLEILGFQVSIPKNFYDLIDVGQSLNNCVANNASFLYRPRNKNQFIITLKKYNQYKFCIDLYINPTTNKISINYDAFKGKANTTPHDSFISDILRHLNDHFEVLYKPTCMK